MTKQNNYTSRILYLDVARAIAMLWIVGYWHLRVYCGRDYPSSYISIPCEYYITNVVLGLFMFLSGFFISNYSFDFFNRDTKAFLYKRLTRFYLLYALSAILLFLMGYNALFGKLSLITTLTLTSTYILPQPRTLWFFSMVAIFYLFSPLLLREPVKSLLYTFVTIYGISLILHGVLPNGIDSRFFWCFPFYCIGLYIGKRKALMTMITSHTSGIICTCLFAIQANHIAYLSNDNLFLQYALLPIGVVIILYYSRLLAILPIARIIRPIAYCSMCAYLFHREIYIGLMVIYDSFSLNYPYFFSVIVFLPICLVISYYLQWLYDKYIIPFLPTLK